MLFFCYLFAAISAVRVRFERADVGGYWQIWSLSIFRKGSTTNIEFEIVDATLPLKGSNVEFISDKKEDSRYIAWCEDTCFLEVEVDGPVSSLTFLWNQDAREVRAIMTGKVLARWIHPTETSLACSRVVQCGTHSAPSCKDCPHAAAQGSFGEDCSGECIWLDGECKHKISITNSTAVDRYHCSSATECHRHIGCDEDTIVEFPKCHNGIWECDQEELLENPSSKCVPPHPRWRLSADCAVRFHEVSFRRNGCKEEISAMAGQDGVAYGKDKLKEVRKAFDNNLETYFLPPSEFPFVEFRFRDGADAGSEDIPCAFVETSPYKGALSLQTLTRNGWKTVSRLPAALKYRTQSILVPPPGNDTGIVCSN